jgi:hypothetical protein
MDGVPTLLSRLRSGKALAAVAVLCFAGAIAACGEDQSGTRVHCATGVVWRGQEYRHDLHKKLPRGAGLGTARQLCSPRGGFLEFDIQRLQGVPPEFALAVRADGEHGDGIYLATGYPVALATHPLHDLYFFSRARPRRLASRRCTGRGTVRGSVVTPISANPQFRLLVAGSRERLLRDRERVIQYHARTTVTRRRHGYPHLPQKAAIEVKGRWCRGEGGIRVLAADVIAPR